MTTEKPYGGKLADERRSERRERLIAAGLDLLGTEGTAATSVRAVCARSGLSSRYFYESFTDLDELLVAVFDEVMAATLDRAIAALLNAPPSTVADAVQLVGSAFISMARDDPRTMKIGFTEAWNSEAVMRRRVERLHQSAKLLSTFASGQADLSGPQAGVDVAAFMVVGGLLEVILAWIDGSITTDLDTTVRHFTVSATAALESAIAASR